MSKDNEKKKYNLTKTKTQEEKKTMSKAIDTIIELCCREPEKKLRKSFSVKKTERSIKKLLGQVLFLLLKKSQYLTLMI